MMTLTVMTHAPLLNLSDLVENMHFLKYLVMYFTVNSLGENEVLDDNSGPLHLQASLEIKAYMKKETTNDSSLQWWTRSAFCYPLLSKMAQR